MMDRHSLLLNCILVFSSILLTACLDDKNSGTPRVSTEKIRPFVSDTFPTTTAATVSPNKIITITFSEAIQPVTTGNIRIAAINQSTGQPETLLSFPQKNVLLLSSQDKVLSVNLANANVNLVSNTQYLVVIEGIKDYAGNVMLGSCEFIFATTGAKLTASQSGPCKAQPGEIGFKLSSDSVAEDVLSGQVTVIVTRINGSDGVVSVDYQTGVVVNAVSATVDIDYVVSIGTLTFEDGITEQSISIPILNDSEVEGDELFNVSLTSISTGSEIVRPLTAGAFPTTTITILDDEIVSSNVLYFVGRSSSVNENVISGNLDVTVSRAITTDAVSVDYTTVDGSAKQAVDYTMMQGTLNFAVGEKIKTITIPIIDDKLPEPRKDFKLLLSNAIGARLNANNSSFTITIDDDDQIIKPGNSILSVSASLKKLHFNWSPVNPNASYTLVENTIEIIKNLTGNHYFLDVPVHLKDWSRISYTLKTCITGVCVDSNRVAISNVMLDSIGYFKPGNTGQDDNFGSATALSDDGLTLIVGSPLEDSDLYGVVNPDNIPTRTVDNNNALNSGAVYVYSRNSSTGDWLQTSYLKASNVQAGDHFGATVTLSGDGLTLAVGAHLEDSALTGTQLTATTLTDNNAAVDAGAVYVFTRASTSTNWSQQAYIKASNTGVGDNFGNSIALDKNGLTLVVGALLEDSIIANVINTAKKFPVIQNTELATIDAGAVYVFARTVNTTTWSQKSYLKSNKPDALDYFGNSIDISGDGSTIVVGAYGDDDSINSLKDSGAVYVFTHDGTGVWSQQEYYNASSMSFAITAVSKNNYLGWSVAISDNGSIVIASAKNTLIRSITQTPVVAGLVYAFLRGLLPKSQGYAAFQPSDQENFGDRVTISGDGNIIAIGVPGDDSNMKGILFSGNKNDLARDAGAVVIVDLRNSTLSLRGTQRIIKASNTKLNNRFGSSVALDINGNTLAVGAITEQSKSIGVKNNSNSAVDPVTDNSVPGAGAVYLY